MFWGSKTRENRALRAQNPARYARGRSKKTARYARDPIQIPRATRAEGPLQKSEPPWLALTVPGAGPGRVFTTALLLMVVSHKFTNKQCPISILWRVVNSLLTSKPCCQSGPGAGRDHVSTQKQGET